MKKYQLTTTSPLGPLLIEASDEGLTRLSFVAQRESGQSDAGGTAPNALGAARQIAEDTRRQLAEYFGGSRRDFDVPLAAGGTEFQRATWNALCEIPFGTTLSYGALALKLGKPSAVRAVGAANGRNPIAIIVPCHRVIGSDGSLTGYAGGLEIKRALLRHEGALGDGDHEQLALKL